MEDNYIIEKNDNHTYIKLLVENLDTSITPSFKSELVMLAGRGEKNILMDLSNTTFCDSDGLSSLIIAERLCSTAKGKLVLTGVNPKVENFISISQLESTFSIVSTIEKARNSFE